MEITSLTNAKVKQWTKYKEKKHREQDQCFLIEGEHLIEEAQKAGLLEAILIEQGKIPTVQGYPTYEVTKDILKKLSDSVSGTYIMAVCHYPKNEIDLKQNLILLDGVQDPGNMGTIIRTALSFGYKGIVLSNHCVDVYNEKVIRSTQGALFHLPIIRCDLCEFIGQLNEQETITYATALKGASSLQEINVKFPHALVFGNEGKGVSDEVLERCAEKVYVEMDTFESLNVAVAAGICMYEFKYRRLKKA